MQCRGWGGGGGQGTRTALSSGGEQARLHAVPLETRAGQVEFLQERHGAPGILEAERREQRKPG